jgi:hypothetical protein
MNGPSPSMRDLARRLLAATRAASPAARPGGGALHQHEVVAICEALRITLTKFAGEDGVSALLRRALSLAAVDMPELQSVRLGANCAMEGLEEGTAGKGGEDAAVALAAHLLDLLVMFIGEPLTLQLVHESWPDLRETASKKDRLS